MAEFTYENGRFYRDGGPFYFRGVEYMYYRDRRENWGRRLDQLKAAHANVICFYTPWRHHLVHDPETGAISYDFIGETMDSRDLKTFIGMCEERGLYMLAKPGPFVHSELNVGGLPDVCSPSFNPGIEPVRTHDGSPLFWEYDNTMLPSPNDPAYDEMVRAWLEEVSRVLRPHAAPNGNIIALQFMDETIYCNANDAPWHFGYAAPDVRHFKRMLRDKYGDVAAYNKAHGASYDSFDLVPVDGLGPGRTQVGSTGSVLDLVDWGEFQWRIRREFYDLYKGRLGIDLPCLMNFAGITPPIEENVPDASEASTKDTPPEFVQMYADWWLAQNRVDLDADVYHYGMISWLGVAAYDIEDASSEPGGEGGENEVFNRYINTARRRRGINIEENWGFSKLYHPLSRHPVIPFFQTLASIAGGCTGHVVFTGVCHDYWTDDLDRTTKKQHPTFPADAPIGPDGETGEMYDAMSLLNEWFEHEGDAFLEAELDMDVCLLVVPEYAAVSSWIPTGRQWALEHEPLCAGRDVLEPATRTFNKNGVNYGIAELPALSVDDLMDKGVAALHLGFFLARSEQDKLVEFVSRGGRLICCGEMPALDERMAPCSVLADFLATGPENVRYSADNVFVDEQELLRVLGWAGWERRSSCSVGMRAFVYRNADDFFVFFFDLGGEGADRHIDFHGMRLELTLGSRTCGVVRVKAGHIESYVVKGVNEYEGVTADVMLKLGEQEIRFKGDKAGYGFSH